MAKYVANAHGEWIQLENDTLTLYVLDTEEPDIKQLIENSDIIRDNIFGNDIIGYGREIEVKIVRHDGLGTGLVAKFVNA